MLTRCYRGYTAEYGIAKGSDNKEQDDSEEEDSEQDEDEQDDDEQGLPVTPKGNVN